MSNIKDKFRKQFRPELGVDDILQWVDQEPGYQYKNVRIDMKGEGPRRIERYVDAGWEPVETTDALKDDRSFTPNSKDKKLRPNYCMSTTTDGCKQILMRIPVEQYEKNQQKKAAERAALHNRQLKDRGDKSQKTAEGETILGSELLIK